MTITANNNGNNNNNNNKNSNNKNRVPLDINSHELSLIEFCVALTLASIEDTRRKSRDSISLDSDILERLYGNLDSLFAKLGKEEKKLSADERHAKFRKRCAKLLNEINKTEVYEELETHNNNAYCN